MEGSNKFADSFLSASVLKIIINNNSNKNNNKKKGLFTDGLYHIMWFSIGHRIKTKTTVLKMTKY